jgi:hypothetical protein
VPPRHLVAAVGTKDQHRRGLECSVQVEQQLGGRAVRPLEVIEEHHRGVPARDPLEDVADRLEQGRLIGLGWTCTELREDERQMPRQRPGPCRPSGTVRW